jgi:hypothetical protein
MIEKPAITAVIPTYRRPKLLRRAIKSALDQTYAQLRVCIYDNASDDETADVVDSFRKKDKRIEYFRRAENIGAFANFVDGGNRVETPFFSFISDDDVMLPRFYEIAMDGFERYPQAAMSILATIRMTPSGSIHSAPILQWPQGLIEAPAGMVYSLEYGNPDLTSIVIRRDVWQKHGGFDRTTEPVCDLEFELSVAAHSPVVVSRQPGGILTLREDTISHMTGIEWVWPAMPRIVNKLNQDPSLSPAAKSAAEEGMKRLMRRNLIMRGLVRPLIAGKWDDARKAANIFSNECGTGHLASGAATAIAVCRTLPGCRAALKAAVAVRATFGKLTRLGLKWRLRSYSDILRASLLESPPQRD